MAHAGHRASDRAAFIARELEQARHFGQPVEARPDGLSRFGRPYVALACYCQHDGCPGFSLVHDHPDDRAHFERLFGEPPPASVQARAAPAASVWVEAAE